MSLMVYVHTCGMYMWILDGNVDEGRGMRDEGRGTRVEGRGSRDEGQGTIKGRGSRDDGLHEQPVVLIVSVLCVCKTIHTITHNLQTLIAGRAKAPKAVNVYIIT